MLGPFCRRSKAPEFKAFSMQAGVPGLHAKIRALRRSAVKWPYSAAEPEGNKTLQRK